MNNDTITHISDKARAILALCEEREALELGRHVLCADHRANLEKFDRRIDAVEQAIKTLGGVL